MLRAYLAVAFLARLAEEGVAVTVVLLAAERTGSPASGAFALTAWMAPHVLAAPLTGGLAARVRRPRAFYSAALCGYAASLAAVAVLLGRAPVALVLVAAAAGGACGPVVSGGLSSLVAGLAPEGPGRTRAYALDAASYNAASVAGPAVAGVLTGAVSAGAASLVLACAPAVAAALTAALPLVAAGRATDPPERAAGLRADLTSGLAAVWRTRELRAITMVTCLAFVGVGGLTTTAALLARARGHEEGGGVLMTAFAVGALAGSLAVARRGTRLSAERTAGLSLLATGAVLAAAAIAPSFALVTVAFVTAGLMDGPLLTATLRLRADHAPPGTRPQVFTIGAGLKITAAAAGAALTGAAAGLPAAALLLAIAALHVAAALLYPVLLRPAASPRVTAASHSVQ
ncbi:MFS transporter [Actinomadura litoris]|uniref:MFS transporter n=1 Tax=Actinomadura litoris TaxID=2678616 RepID=UPI001C1298CB|nr:MFS transporter [Actinomadura litoris]